MVFSDQFVISHDVTAGVKKQAVSKQKIYSLVDVKKGGILVDIMRNAIRRRDFTMVDNQIRQLVQPFLYNEGKGKKVPISRLIRLRNKERNDDDFDDENDNLNTKSNNRSRLLNFFCRLKYNSFRRRNILPVVDYEYREICWKINERGSVGETILHLCLLVSTPIHIELAKRVVNLFPKLVNDIYLDDEYYGESALHMAVVNEDPLMVKFLLNNGADVTARAIGKFFCADDQKETREEVLDHEWYIMKIQTNYMGHVYWGEYPLSFAACLELEDCYRILYARGADPDCEDTNGNTVLHLTVISNKINMFNLAYELGADLHKSNKQGLTPLSLSAKLTRIEMFFHILKLQREVFWQFCEQAFAAYPLEEIDSIDVHTGQIRTTNALSVVAFGDELGHLDMFEGLLIEILQAKWNTFIKKRFYQQIAFYGIYFFITFFAFILRPAPVVLPVVLPSMVVNCIDNSSIDHNFNNVCLTINRCKAYSQTYNLSQDLKTNSTFLEIFSNIQMNDKNNSNELFDNKTHDSCYLLGFQSSEDQIRRVFELMTAIGSLVYLMFAYIEAKSLSFKVFIQTLSKVPGRIMFLMSCILVVISIPLRFACLSQYEDRIISLVMFLTPMNLLFFCRGFKTVGPFVVMIYKMIVSDLLCFVIIYMIFVIGFAEAFFVIFRSHSGDGTNYFAGVVDSIMSMFLMSLNEFVGIYQEFDKTDHPFIAKFMFILYMILVSILLVNMLIAMMGKTYQDIASRPNEWLRQWARIILVVERGVSPKQRLNFQKKYSHLRGQRVFIKTWETTETDRNDIKDIKTLKNSNNKMRNKMNK